MQRLVAGVIVVCTVIATPMVLLGVSMGGCWHECDRGALGAQVALAFGAAAATAGIGVLGAKAALAGWRYLVGWIVGVWILGQVVGRLV